MIDHIMIAIVLGAFAALVAYVLWPYVHREMLLRKIRRRAMLDTATGEALDTLAELFAMKRIVETDESLRARIDRKLKELEP